MTVLFVYEHDGSICIWSSTLYLYMNMTLYLYMNMTVIFVYEHDVIFVYEHDVYGYYTPCIIPIFQTVTQFISFFKFEWL